MENSLLLVLVFVTGVVVYRTWIKRSDVDLNRDRLLREAGVVLSAELGISEETFKIAVGLEKVDSAQSNKSVEVNVKASFRKVSSSEVDVTILASSIKASEKQRREAQFYKRLNWEDVPKDVREYILRSGKTGDGSEVVYDLTATDNDGSKSKGDESSVATDKNTEIIYEEIAGHFSRAFSVEKSEILSVLKSEDVSEINSRSQRIKIECTIEKTSPSKVKLDVNGWYVPIGATRSAAAASISIKKRWEDLPKDVRSAFLHSGEKTLKFMFGKQTA